MQANIKTKNGKKLKVKALVDSRCTHRGIDEQLVKDKRIQTKLINFSFEVFSTDRMKNGEVTKVALLEVKINGHKETLEAIVMDLDRMDMFVKIVDGGLYFIFPFHFPFYFTLLYFSFLFLFLEQTRVRAYQSRCHIKSQIDGVVTRLITRLGRRK